METRDEGAGGPGDAERALAALRPHVRASMNAPLPIVVTTGTDHAVCYANGAFLRAFGCALEAVAGKPFARFHAAAAELAPLLDRALRDGTTLGSGPLAFRRADGETVHALALAAPLSVEDEPRALVITFFDQSRQERQARNALETARAAREANEALVLAALREQRLAEEARQTAAQLEAVLANMNEGVCIVDWVHRRLLTTVVSRRMLGLLDADVTLEALDARPFRRPDGTPMTTSESPFARAARGERFADEELQLPLPDGAIRTLLCSGSAVPAEGGAVALTICVFRDVTDLRALEQTRAQYVSLISHDLRGPLSSVNAAAHLLARVSDRPDLSARIVTNVGRIEGMLNDLLDANLIRAGQHLPLRLRPCDLGFVARELVNDLTAMHGDRFELRVEGDVHGLWGPDELRRALWNLASNAVRYGDPDRPILVAVANRGGHVAASVHNEGPPIPLDEQRRLFDPYARGSTADASGSRGWGLGLTLVRGCAEAHGGVVRIDSAPGRGTTFTIELPWDARAGGL